MAGAAMGLLLMGVLLGCGAEKLSEPFHDAPRGKQTNDSPADVIEMPDGFNNLATKCDHGNRIYVTYHADSPYGAVAVVPNAEGC
jgi:hypothetical protein